MHKENLTQLSKKNILFFCDNFPPEFNAAASRIYERACYWVKWNYQMTVITSVPNFPEGKVFAGYKNKFYQIEIINNIRVIRIKTFISANKGFLLRILDYMSYTLPAIIAGLFHKNADVIIANTPTPFVAFAGMIVAKIKRKPFILEVSDLWPASIVGVGVMQNNRVIRLLEKFELFLYKHAKAIAVSTPAFKNNLVKRKIAENKITITINGVDLHHYSPRIKNKKLLAQYRIDDNAFVAGYIGTHGMAHALENIVLAAEQIPHITFLFVGPGAAREKLIDLANAKSLTNIHFISAQPKELIPEFWSMCDVAIVHLKNSPVFSEVLPSKIFEAMGMGKPIILSAPKGEATRLIEQEKVGMVVEPEQHLDLAQAIQFLSQQKVLFEKYTLNSRISAKKYSREQQAATFFANF